MFPAPVQIHGAQYGGSGQASSADDDLSGVLSPASAAQGMQSPVSPVALFAVPTGPQTRRGAAHAASAHSAAADNGHAAANPWSSAASNPLGFGAPHQSVAGAHISHYAPSQQHQQHPSSLVSHPQIHFDRSSSGEGAFTLPSGGGGGGGESPLPSDYSLPTTASSGGGKHKNGGAWWSRKRLVASLRSFRMHLQSKPSRSNWQSWALAAGAVLFVVIVLVLGWRALRGGGGAGGGSGANAGYGYDFSSNNNNNPYGARGDARAGMRANELPRSGAYGGRQRDYHGEGGGAGAYIEQQQQKKQQQQPPPLPPPSQTTQAERDQKLAADKIQSMLLVEAAKKKSAAAAAVAAAAAGVDGGGEGEVTPPKSKSSGPSTTPLLTRQQKRVAAAAALAARSGGGGGGGGHPKHASASSSSPNALLDRGLAEIKRLKSNLRAMKDKLRKEQASKAAAKAAKDDAAIARAAAAASSVPTSGNDRDQNEEDPAEEEDAVANEEAGVAVGGDVEKEIEAFKAEMIALQQQEGEQEQEGQEEEEQPSEEEGEDGGAETETDAETDEPQAEEASEEPAAAVEAEYEWLVSDWDACDAPCGDGGSGRQTRQIMCRKTSSGARVSDRLCSDSTPPELSRPCKGLPCDTPSTAAAPATVTTTTDEKQQDEPASPISSEAAAAVAAAAAAAVAASASASASSASYWPTLAQYYPDWSASEPPVGSSSEASCPSSLWGRAFLGSKGAGLGQVGGGKGQRGDWLRNNLNEVQCGVERNPDEHASVEVVRLPRANLPQLSEAFAKADSAATTAGAAAREEALRTTQVTDSFLRIKHALFHPTAVRYTTHVTSPQKIAGVAATAEHAGGSAESSSSSSPSFGLSLDCTAVSSLRTRSHLWDASVDRFMKAMHFLSATKPPLVTPSDPNSKSIFTRAFERLTDQEYEYTTVFVHRTCSDEDSSSPSPSSVAAAQCLGDLFAVYSIASALGVEFQTLRIVFLDSGGEGPYWGAWTRLASPGQVFTRHMWSRLRLPPFDQEDVYVTSGVFVGARAAQTLFNMGENVIPPLIATATAGASEESQQPPPYKCTGQSALHVAFNRLMGDVFLHGGFSGSGDAASSAEHAQQVVMHLQHHAKASAKDAQAIVDADAKTNAHNNVVHMVVASGSGGGGGDSGHHISNLPALISELGSSFPGSSLRVSSFPTSPSSSSASSGGLASHLAMLGHSGVLLGVRGSSVWNHLMLLGGHTRALNVIEVSSAADDNENKETGASSMVMSQGMERLSASAASTSSSSSSSSSFSVLQPTSHAVFSARWLCEKLGCASFRSLVVPVSSSSSSSATSIEVPSAAVVDLLASIDPPILPAPVRTGAGAGKASSGLTVEIPAASTVTSNEEEEDAPLEEYEASEAEVAAEEAALKASAAAARIREEEDQAIADAAIAAAKAAAKTKAAQAQAKVIPATPSSPSTPTPTATLTPASTSTTPPVANTSSASKPKPKGVWHKAKVAAKASGVPSHPPTPPPPSHSSTPTHAKAPSAGVGVGSAAKAKKAPFKKRRFGKGGA